MPKKNLLEIFKGLEVEVKSHLQSIEIEQIHYDSRRIKKGGLFVAIKGFHTNGHHYLAQAKKAGAIAAVVEEIHQDTDLPQIQVRDSRQALAILARNFYSPEIDRLSLIGITGTNGKTTTSILCRSILETAGCPTGLIGTIAYHVGKKTIDAWNTTPESVDLYGMLFDMKQQGQQACVLEVSSHALALQRILGLQFDAAVFTNFSRDHLDFHKDDEDYFQAKARLFSMLKNSGTAIIGYDDAYGRRLMDLVDRPVLTFGFGKDALVRTTDWQMQMSGMKLRILTPSGELKMVTKLISQFNIQNIMAAVAVGLALDIRLDEIGRGIEAVEFIPGRLQSIEIKPEVLAVIDYSHTPDSLQKALQTLRPVTEKRLIVVFGCGGDRDKGKRPIMGRIAGSLADLAIVTSDNPRSEEPELIIEDILRGMSSEANKLVIPDRRLAIQKAVSLAGKGDIILIAGKGHEKYQEIKGIKYTFDEVALLKEAAHHA